MPRGVNDRLGQEFGNVRVIEFAGVDDGHARWTIYCNLCGNVKDVLASGLKTAQSCGCQKGNLKHGQSRHGATTPEYHCWTTIKGRCYNPKSARYTDWGGRGIRVCERWLESFNNFFEDMGPKPTSRHSIERRDNNGSYDPANCYWATPAQQNRNKRTTKLTIEKAREIRQMLCQGGTERGLAKIFGVSNFVIGAIGRNRLWQEDAECLAKTS